MPDCDYDADEWFKKELGLAIGGATLFIVVSKVSLLLNLLHKKSWFTDLMTFLVALSMGTMYCVTLVQFIPEAFGKLKSQTRISNIAFLVPPVFINFLGLHTEFKYKAKDACDVEKLDQYFHLFDNMPPFMKTDCREKCSEDEDNECTLTIGGPEMYIWLSMVAYIATIVFYLSEHIINFISWSRTAKKESENGEIKDNKKKDIRRTNR